MPRGPPTTPRRQPSVPRPTRPSPQGLGAGYDFGHLTVNAGGTYSPKATLSGSNAAYPANGGQAIQSYTTSMSQFALDAGIIWRL